MTGTLYVFRAEWFRLRHSRSALACMIALALLAFLRVAAARLAERAAFAASVQRAFTEGRALPEASPPTNAYGPFVDGWAAGLTVATLLLLVLAARSLAADLESGLLRLPRTRSVSRGALVLGRALLGIPLCLLCVLVTAVGAWLGATWLFDFGPVIEDGYELVSVQEIHGELAQATMATLPPLVATWAFGLLISSISRTGAGAVAGALVVYLGFDLFKEVLGSAQYWVFAAFNPSFIDHSYVKEVAAMARGYSDAGFSPEVFRMNLVLPWPEAALLIGLAWLVLSRRGL